MYAGHFCLPFHLIAENNSHIHQFFGLGQIQWEKTHNITLLELRHHDSPHSAESRGKEGTKSKLLLKVKRMRFV
jgi:hypothetical protein